MFVSFRTGMSMLIETLIDRLGEGAIQTEAAVGRLVRNPDHWKLELRDGSSVEADAVILACPGHASSAIVREIAPELADELNAIPYASSATMSMAFDRDQVSHALDGFGFVVPAVEKRTLIAATFSNVKFPGRAPEGGMLIRAFLGGATHPHIYQMSDDALREGVLRDLRDLVGLRGEPRFVELYRWPNSMPQYPVGHLARVQEINRRVTKWPGLAVAGNAFGGVGIPDCVHSGEIAAKHIVESLRA